MSTKDAAKAIGIPLISLFLYEKGYFRPAKNHLEKIESFYGPIDYSEGREYPQEVPFVINVKGISKKRRTIISAILAVLSLGLIITGSCLFNSSASNVESYYGETYNEVRKFSLEKGNVSRDIVADLEYSYLYNKDFNGKTEVTFYRTNSILYFNNSSYTVSSSLDKYEDLGVGTFRYQFGGSLGKNSYVCTFSYKNNDVGMFFSSDVYYENKPIEKVDKLNVILEGSTKVTEELAVDLFNARIDAAMTLLTAMLTKQLGHDIDFYNDFLKAREEGRAVNHRLQITGLALLFGSLISFFVSFSVLVFGLISLVKHIPEEIAEDGDKPLPKDISIHFGLPEYLTSWVLKIISAASLLVLLTSIVLGMFMKLPPLFSNETFLNICKVGFASGGFIRLLLVISSYKSNQTILTETIKFTLLYLAIAVFETTLVGVTEAWGYNVSNLLYNYIPANIFLAVVLNYLIVFFLFFTPPFIRNKAKWVVVLWRVLSIVPLGLIIAITLIGHSYELFYGASQNIYLIFWLSNSKLALSIITVVFVYTLFFIRLFYKKRYASAFFKGDKFALISNISCSIIILILALTDLGLQGNTIAYYLGFGSNFWILLFIPLILLTKYGQTHLIINEMSRGKERPS